MKLYKLLAATNRERFAPAVVSMKNRGELRERIEALGIPVYTLGIRGPLPGLFSIIRLIRIVRQFQPELIHGWMYHGNLAAQVAAAFVKQKVSVLWSIHQSLYGFEYEKSLTAAIIKLCARISRLPEQIIYISNTSATQHERFGYNKDKRLVLYYGFDTERFAPSKEARCSLRSELGLEQDSLLVGLIGRYHPVKDHSNFLKAAALLSRSQPHVRFVLCGKGIDWDNKLLSELVNELQLAARVHLLGERHDMPRIMAALDIAASSSFSEGFPNVVGEAMSSGVPCVVTVVSDLPDIVGPTGRTVPPRNAAALAAAIEELVASGAERCGALGAMARTRIIEHYALDAAVAQYQGVYESALALVRARTAKARPLSRAALKRLARLG